MKFILFFSVFLALEMPLFGMGIDAENVLFDKNFVLQRAKISNVLNEMIRTSVKDTSQSIRIEPSEVLKNLVKFSYDDNQYIESMDELFDASEQLIIKDDFSTLQRHPLYKYFQTLDKNSELFTSLKSGPDIQDFTFILLGEHELDVSKVHLAKTISMKIFNNAETFFRCLEIFKNAYQKHTGKFISCDLSYSLHHTPLVDFCKKYLNLNPQLGDVKNDLFEQIVNLLSVFEVDNAIVNMNIKITMSVQDKQDFEKLTSFRPIFLHLSLSEDNSTNDISLGQQNLDKQIQNLSGSELAMPYIKDSDGREQFEALNSLLAKKSVNLLEIGGGRGETNAVVSALQKTGLEINLFNAEPYEPFAKTYIDAHKAIGVDKVDIIQKTAQELSPNDVIHHFNRKADAILASHSFYFILGDLHKATQAYLSGDLVAIEDHPLTKYFDMLEEDGALVVTLQSGAGARLFRNALLGNHGLDSDNKASDKTVLLLRSFGNLETFLRHFEFFSNLYEQQTSRKIHVKMYCAVANVPLGGLKIEQDQNTGGYSLHNPYGNDTDPSWLCPKMMDFYGNWKELQALATLTFEDAKNMMPEDLKKLGIEKLSRETLEAKRELAIKTQATFLHILRAFSPGLMNMQHPNITLEITVDPKK